MLDSFVPITIRPLVCLRAFVGLALEKAEPSYQIHSHRRMMTKLCFRLLGVLTSSTLQAGWLE
jgi:hypothetical protein